MEEMKELLEKSIKVLTPKEKAKKLREQNLKRKLEEAEVDGENEENQGEEEEEEGGDKEKDVLQVIMAIILNIRRSFLAIATDRIVT
ncbi:hypothetical protein MTR_2g084505 [Medicago truncatula]|uniref:Uncharacterized protein n=1 Tax=Medicago truncatula TaxID=3880 RepID=A0A072VLA4_MEDTR|nr:hypothetical protein MTR_2g084505 [Medicago truncatula]